MENPNASDVIVGGVSFRVLEDRIRALESLLAEKQTSAEKQAPRTPTESVKQVDLKPDGSTLCAPESSEIAVEEVLIVPSNETIDEVEIIGQGNADVEDEETGFSLKPTYTRMSRRHLSIETLQYFQLPFTIDERDPEYIIIKRWVPEREQDALWEHTRELRRKRDHGFKRSSLFVPPEILGKIERLPFEEWEKSKNEKNAALQVATEKIGSNAHPMPVRLSIHSSHIIRCLRATSKLEIPESVNVMLPPWKLLVTYETEIRKYVEEMGNTRFERQRFGTAPNTESQASPVEEFAKSSEDRAPNESANVVDFEEKKARFADEKIEIGNKSLHDGTTDIKVVNMSSLCKICKNEHVAKFDCLPGVMSHLRCLLTFLDVDLAPVFQLRKRIAAGTLTHIAFSDLWHLFNPGDLIFTTEPRHAYRVFHTTGGRKCLNNSSLYEKRPAVNPFRIDCTYMGYDTAGIAPCNEMIEILEYSGELPVKALSCMAKVCISRTSVSAYPAQFESDQEDTIDYLVKRGKRYQDLLSFAHKYYKGFSTRQGDPVEGEIITDWETIKDATFRDNLPGTFAFQEYEVREIAEGCVHLPPSNIRDNRMDVGCRCWRVFDDFCVDSQRAKLYKGDDTLLQMYTPGQPIESEEKLMLCRPDIRVYFLHLNQWLGVWVDQVYDLEDPNCPRKRVTFDDLTLDKAKEALFRSFARKFVNPGFPAFPFDSKSYTYLISKKLEQQKRLHILLHGPPSSGKSSTVAALSTYTSRPLYHLPSSLLTSFSIGTDHDSPDLVALNSLETHLHRAARWHSILYIPDADVLFAYRVTNFLDPEAMSATRRVFGLLETYPGIVVFLTRSITAMSEAFLGRMNLVLKFQKLDRVGAMKLWRRKLEGVRKEYSESTSYKQNGAGHELMTKEMIEDIMRLVEKGWDDDGLRWDARAIGRIVSMAEEMLDGGDEAITGASLDGKGDEKKTLKKDGRHVGEAQAEMKGAKPGNMLHCVQILIDLDRQVIASNKAAIKSEEDQDRERFKITCCGGDARSGDVSNTTEGIGGEGRLGRVLRKSTRSGTGESWEVLEES